MKKIAFSDKYGLTQAVLEGRKTMTRRFVPEIVLDWNRRDKVVVNNFFLKGDLLMMDLSSILGESYITAVPKEYQPRYQIDEEVAIAQKYLDLKDCKAFYEALAKADPTFPLECIKDEKGCYNKMFVKADWMPNRIKIINIRIEHLHDITEEDALKEGVEMVLYGDEEWYKVCDTKNGIKAARTAKEAFAGIIDKLYRKGTWNINPWVFVYEFKLI